MDKVDDGDKPLLCVDGTTFRDWFAGQALAGLLSGKMIGAQSAAQYATTAYEIADAMIEARG